MRDRRRRRITIIVVERRNGDVVDGPRINAPHIDAETIGVTARHIERLHAAAAAEQMPRGAGVERYSTSASSPASRREYAAGTIRCRKPVILQVVQLQSSASIIAGVSTSKRT